MADDDDKPVEYNFHVVRESEINNILSVQQDYRFLPNAENVICNSGYRLTGQPSSFDGFKSPGWLVCTWSPNPIIDLVLKDLINEGGHLKFYNRVGTNEIFHVELSGRARDSDWVTKKIFIPEQVLYAFPRPAFMIEFAEPISLLLQLSKVKAAICDKLRPPTILQHSETLDMFDSFPRPDRGQALGGHSFDE